MLKKSLILASSFLLPIFVLAAEPTNDVENLITKFGNILNVLVAIAITLALLFFIWGLAMYIQDTGNVEKNAEGKNRMIQGIIALFVIVSIWGIISFVGGTLGIEQGGDAELPGVPGIGNSGSGGRRGSGQTYEACYNTCLAEYGDEETCDLGCR